MGTNVRRESRNSIVIDKRRRDSLGNRPGTVPNCARRAPVPEEREGTRDVRLRNRNENGSQP